MWENRLVSLDDLSRFDALPPLRCDSSAITAPPPHRPTNTPARHHTTTPTRQHANPTPQVAELRAYVPPSPKKTRGYWSKIKETYTSAPQNEESSKEADGPSLMVDVVLGSDGRRIITIRSQVQVHNVTSIPVELLFKAGDSSVTDRLSMGTGDTPESPVNRQAFSMSGEESRDSKSSAGLGAKMAAAFTTSPKKESPEKPPKPVKPPKVSRRSTRGSAGPRTAHESPNATRPIPTHTNPYQPDPTRPDPNTARERRRLASHVRRIPRHA